MPYFDRTDICAAHSLIESHYHKSGWLRARPSNQRRMESTGVQLRRMGYYNSAGVKGLFTGTFNDLSENGQEIYKELEYRYGFISEQELEEWYNHER